ncbi:hypothetical protein [Sutterella sp.]|uniref:hypothetical protein n=1 Tax=Sutterella sp. TaxID=1981025 RepID=UPI0025D3F346|nr:hypothetical protein [uncultured Sutterella sp.]
MKHILLPAALGLLLAVSANAAPAAPDAPPPYAGDVAAQSQTAPKPDRVLPPKAAQDGMSLAPTEEDMRRARANREAGVQTPRNNDKRTKIEAVRDPNNHVTEYVVTPGSTKIPYTMENRADRPIDTTPGRNPSSTLGTPKFIEFGW